MKGLKSKLLSAVIMTVFLLTSSPMVAHWSNNVKNGGSTQCSILERKELKQFEKESKVVQQQLWSAEWSLKWYKAQIKQLKKDIKKASGKNKIKLQNQLSKFEKEAKVVQQKLWSAEWSLKWYKAEIKKLEKLIKKLDKECDNSGYGHDKGKKNGNKDSWKAWWKKW